MTDNYQATPVAGEAVAGAIDAREWDLIARIRNQCDHAGVNDMRLVPRFGQAEGPIAVPEVNLLAAVEGWQRAHGLLADPSNTEPLGWNEIQQLASRDESPASPDAGAGAVAAPIGFFVPKEEGGKLLHQVSHRYAKDPRYVDKGLWLYAAPASAPEAPEQQGEVEVFIGYVCRAWGETEHPSVELVRDIEGVRRFMVREWLGEEDATDYDGTPTLPPILEEIAERDWRGEGEWSIEFEVGGVSVEQVFCTSALAQAAPATGKVGAVVDMVLHCPKCGMQHIDGVEELPMAVPGSAAEGSAGWVNPPHRSHLCRPEDGGCGHIWRPADVPTNGVQAVRTTGKADSPVATPAPTVQAETGEEVQGADLRNRLRFELGLLLADVQDGIDHKSAAQRLLHLIDDVPKTLRIWRKEQEVVAWLLKIDGKPRSLGFVKGEKLGCDRGDWTWHPLSIAHAAPAGEKGKTS